MVSSVRMSSSMNNRNIFFHVCAIFFLGVGLMLFFWPTVISGRIYSMNGLIFSDYLNFNFPIHQLYKEKLLAGKLPWWVNEIGDGYPLVAEGQLGAFYPLRLLLFSFLPTNPALNLFIFVHFWIAAAGVYLVVMKLTRFRASAILAGFSFALSGLMVRP